ncbi:uncharacterized protein LOC107636810 isoform X2 [Arachis ipaensis]|uniref:uncharacterized protein LOC107636810 isoform X2 n=1 Tax=Arachis ipaensis TaxID=130454 RepID=UPI000A2B70CB|nr:uncharacterized protein LOC107636810 isoform X2 [Arachis ipaensis]
MDTEEATAEESKSMKSTKSRGHKDHNSDIIFLYFSLSFYPGKQRKKVETRQGGARDAYWHRKQWDDSDGDRLHGREVTVAAPEAASNGLGAMILYALLMCVESSLSGVELLMQKIQNLIVVAGILFSNLGTKAKEVLAV